MFGCPCLGLSSKMFGCPCLGLLEKGCQAKCLGVPVWDFPVWDYWKKVVKQNVWVSLFGIFGIIGKRLSSKMFGCPCLGLAKFVGVSVWDFVFYLVFRIQVALKAWVGWASWSTTRLSRRTVGLSPGNRSRREESRRAASKKRWFSKASRASSYCSLSCWNSGSLRSVSSKTGSGSLMPITCTVPRRR